MQEKIQIDIKQMNQGIINMKNYIYIAKDLIVTHLSSNKIVIYFITIMYKSC